MDSQKLNVCLWPFEIRWENRDYNLSEIERGIKNIHPDTDLLVLPETFISGFPVNTTREEVERLAESSEGEIIRRLAALSRLYNLAIAGSLVVIEGDKIFNRAFFIEPSGDIYHADKAHLFRMGNEHNIFTPGDKRLNVRFRGWNISMIVCYDLRFPVWCRNRSNEYDLLLVVANWPKVRDKVWDSLLTARAIENLSYVCGVNCKGIDTAGNEYSGLSRVIDYKGKDVSVNVPGTDFIYATLYRDQLDNFREKFPAWLDADEFELRR